MVSEGEAVNPGQALFTVVNTDYLELAGQVPVNQAARVRAGQPVEFSLAAYPGRVFRGEVARVEPTADPATRQVGVYVRLPNRDRALVGGLFATGRILTGGAVGGGGRTRVRRARGSGERDATCWAVEEGVVVTPARDGRQPRRGARGGGRDPQRPPGGGEQVVVAPGDSRRAPRSGSVPPAAPAPDGEEG